METLEGQFVSRVSAFLGRWGLSPTAFGKKGLGDRNLMRQIARGRSPSLRTADRILAFISEQDGECRRARDPPSTPATPETDLEAKSNKEEQDDEREPEE